MPFNLACIQDIQSQNEKFQNSLMSVFHRGICTLAVHHEKSLVPAFFKVPVDHLFANVHCNDSGKINYCCGKKS